MHPAYAREERHAEKVHPQCLVGMDQSRDVAHHDIADLDHTQLDRGRKRDTVCGRDSNIIVAWGGMDAEPGGIAGSQ